MVSPCGQFYLHAISGMEFDLPQDRLELRSYIDLLALAHLFVEHDR